MQFNYVLCLLADAFLLFTICLFDVENCVISCVSELFRCRTRGTEYGFDYTLFGDLVPEKCRVMVHPTEVILSLAKQEKGMWSRLLKEKHKVSKHLSLPLSVFLSFCSPSHFSLLFVHLSISASTSHLYFFMLSILFSFFSSLFFFFFGGGGGMSDNIFIYLVIHIFKFYSSSHLPFRFSFCHPLIHPPIQSVQSSTSLSHYTSIAVYLPVLFLHSSL